MKEGLYVSVIIPVYNAGSSLPNTLDSLLSQAYSEIELILVNDCSTDKTVEVIERYIPLFQQRGIKVKLVNHTTNQGVAVARNTGLDQATGTFIYFLDADDWIEADTISETVRVGVEENVDIVGCNWYLAFGKKERKMNQPSFYSSAEAIENILTGNMRWNLWLFLVRRDLYERYSIRFVPGKNMGEDLLVMITLFTKATRVSYIPRAFYHYDQTNTRSLTKVHSEDHIEQVTYNVYESEKVLKDSRFKDDLGMRIEFLKLHIKLPLLISNNVALYNRWLQWFPESHPYIMQNTAMSLRVRLIQLAALKRQFWLVRLYYFFVVKVVYGVLYN